MSIFKNIFGKKKQSGKVSPYKHRFYAPDFDKYNDFGQIIAIFEYTLFPDFSIANKAAETIYRLLNSVKVYQNKQLYETFRYIRIKNVDIKKFDKFKKELKISLLCIASMNGNGYTREEALNKLIKLQSQSAIPFILFRLADWVVPVRRKAEKAIAAFLVEENTIYFIKNHKLLNWLLHIKRIDLSELYNQIVESVASKQLKSEDLNELSEGDRFFYYRSLAKAGLIDNKMINQMLADKYYLIRYLLVKHLDEAEDLKAILIKLLSDKSQKVRQAAVNLIAKQDLTEYETILRKLIFDNSTSVRIEARQLLNKIDDYDFKKMYMESLSNKNLIIGSILGLSEISEKSEIPLFQNYLYSERAKIRTASLIGIYNLDNDVGTETAYQVLESENPVSTRRVAETILAKQGIDYKRLRNLYDLTDLPGKKIILRLFNRFGGWSVAGDYIKALADSEEEIQLLASVYLESWNNYTIRLATKQTSQDKDYVLNWYKKANENGIGVPVNIPFIFGQE